MLSFQGFLQSLIRLGGSPGLVIMGGESFSEGHGFESQHLIVDGHFFTQNFCFDFSLQYSIRWLNSTELDGIRKVAPLVQLNESYLLRR